MISFPLWVPTVIATLTHHDGFPLPSFNRANTVYNEHGIKTTRIKSVNTAPLLDLIIFSYREFVPSGILFILSSPGSIAPLLRPMTHILRQWTHLIPPSRLNKLPRWIVGTSGPFGYGCNKGCQFLCAYMLLLLRERWMMTPEEEMGRIPKALDLGPLPKMKSVILVGILSWIVNLVLMTWSKTMQSRGNHGGLNEMVGPTLGRVLTLRERLVLALMALGNAVCEESVSRGFYHDELMVSGGLSKEMANVVQAAAFGLWHYRGVPSGVVGVGLTFVYGWIMGLLMNYGGGLLLPIVTHAIADYFIFAVLVRRE